MQHEEESKSGHSQQTRRETKRFSMLSSRMPFMTLDENAALVFAKIGRDEATKLSDFCITHIIGEGKFGKVYIGELP